SVPAPRKLLWHLSVLAFFAEGGRTSPRKCGKKQCDGRGNHAGNDDQFEPGETTPGRWTKHKSYSFDGLDEWTDRLAFTTSFSGAALPCGTGSGHSPRPRFRL